MSQILGNEFPLSDDNQWLKKIDLKCDTCIAAPGDEVTVELTFDGSRPHGYILFLELVTLSNRAVVSIPLEKADPITTFVVPTELEKGSYQLQIRDQYGIFDKVPFEVTNTADVTQARAFDKGLDLSAQAKDAMMEGAVDDAINLNKRAERYFLTAATTDVAIASWKDLGLSLLDRNRPSEAVCAFQFGLQLFEGSNELQGKEALLYLLGEALYRDGKHELAQRQHLWSKHVAALRMNETRGILSREAVSRIEKLHERAMKQWDASDRVKLTDRELANEYLYNAFEIESCAARLLSEHTTIEPIRSTLYLNAAAFAVDCGEYGEATYLLLNAENGNPSEDVAKQIEERLQYTEARYKEVLNERGRDFVIPEPPVELLKRSVQEWNNWRNSNRRPLDLRNADLSAANLKGADLRAVDLRGANLSGVNLTEADLSRADLRHAILSHATLVRTDLHLADLRQADLSDGNTNLREANLYLADLSGALLEGAILRRAKLHAATLTRANLRGADFFQADLSDATLTEAKLHGATLRGATCHRADLRNAAIIGADLQTVNIVEANLEGADLSYSKIHGISAWNVQLTRSVQHNLVITRDNEPKIIADDLEIAQLLYRITSTSDIHSAIDTRGRRTVLILSDISSGITEIVSAVQSELRLRGYLPVIFTFSKSSVDAIETIDKLAQAARFVIADFSYSSGMLAKELSLFAKLPKIAIQPITSQEAAENRAVFASPLSNVLSAFAYGSSTNSWKYFVDRVITSAEEKTDELRREVAYA